MPVITQGLPSEAPRPEPPHVRHGLRGPVPPHRELKEELVDRKASRRLVPSMKELVDAMVTAM